MVTRLVTHLENLDSYRIPNFTNVSSIFIFFFFTFVLNRVNGIPNKTRSKHLLNSLAGPTHRPLVYTHAQLIRLYFCDITVNRKITLIMGKSCGAKNFGPKRRPSRPNHPC